MRKRLTTTSGHILHRYNFVDFIIIAFLIMLVTLIFIPILYIFSASLSNPQRVFSNPLFILPQGFTTTNFRFLLHLPQIWQGYFNSLVYTIVGIAFNVSVTVLAGYALSRKELCGRRVMNFLVTITMFVSGGMIPLFLIVRNLGLLDTRWAIWMPTLISTWNLLVTRTYLTSNIPESLRDAAEVDGASEARYFFQIVLPLSIPIIAVLMMFYGASHWNAWFNAMIYLRDRSLFPLQLILRELLILEQDPAGLGAIGDIVGAAELTAYHLTLRYAIMVIAILPVMILFPFIQHFLSKGVVIGAIKE